jgi:hypothetical protein
VQIQIEIVESVADMNAPVPEATIDTSGFVDAVDAAAIAENCTSAADPMACGAQQAQALAPPPAAPLPAVEIPAESPGSSPVSPTPPPPVGGVPTSVVLDRLNTTVPFCCFVLLLLQGLVLACVTAADAIQQHYCLPGGQTHSVLKLLCQDMP